MMFLINYWLFPFEKIDSLGYDFHKRISVSFFFNLSFKEEFHWVFEKANLKRCDWMFFFNSSIFFIQNERNKNR